MPDWNSRSIEFKGMWQYSIGFYGVWIAHVGRKTGLFEAIAKHPAIDPNDLASGLHLNSDAVRVWCSAAVALGFLKIKKKNTIYLSAAMREILLEKSSPNYLGGQFSYLALRSLEYGALENMIKDGKTNGLTTEAFDAIVEATDWDHNAFLSAIKQGRKNKTNKLHKMLTKGCRVLDVGCGTGTFIKKLVQNYPECLFVGVEPLSNAAYKAIKNMGADKRIDVLVQSGEDMIFDNEFDIVYLGESLYAAADKQAVVSNCYRALKQDGAIAIVEGLLPDKPLNHNNNNKSKKNNSCGDADRDDESRLIMAMQIDFLLQGYHFMSREEILSLLKTAGFVDVSFSDFGGSLYLITGWKHI
jgi:ubiquinone/menaquinone biosynthesis C-methylase UbiE